MSEGIRSALPAQFQQKSALDRGHRGKPGGADAEPFTNVLGQSQTRPATRGAERGEVAEAGRSDAENQEAATDQGGGTAETNMQPGGDTDSLTGATLALPREGTDKTAFSTGGRSTGVGLSESGETPARAARFQPTEGSSRLPHLPGLAADASRTSGPATAQPEPGHGLRAVLLNGAAAKATATAGEGQGAGAAGRSLLELAAGTGQSRSSEPAAALQQLLARRGNESGRATPGTATPEADGRKGAGTNAGEARVRAGPVPETPHLPETKESEQSPRRIEGRAEATRMESRLESALRSQPNAADGKSPETAGGKVNVLGAQNTPAPAAPSPGLTSSALVGALDADGAWKPMLSEAATLAGNPARRGGEVLQSIRIQLQPASLGTVTARLSVQGDQMSVDLQVETTEARQRLAADSDAIVKSLRALGYDVDRVTVQQAQQPPAGNATQNSAGRGTSFQAETGHGGASGERSQNGQGNQAGHEGERYGTAGHGQANSGRDGLYI